MMNLKRFHVASSLTVAGFLFLGAFSPATAGEHDKESKKDEAVESKGKEDYKFNYTLRFDDPGTVAVGMPVLLDGVKIGEVKQINKVSDSDAADLVIAMRPQFAENTIPPAPNSTGRVRTDGTIPHIEVLIRGDRTGGLQQNTIVEGVDGWAEQLAWASKQSAKDSWEAAEDFWSPRIKGLTEWSNTDDGKKLRERADRFFDSVQVASARGLENAEDNWEKVVDKGSDLVGELRDVNAQDAANEVIDTMQELVRNAQELEAETREKLQRKIAELRQTKTVQKIEAEAKEVARDIEQQADDLKDSIGDK